MVVLGRDNSGFSFSCAFITSPFGVRGDDDMSEAKQFVLKGDAFSAIMWVRGVSSVD